MRKEQYEMKERLYNEFVGSGDTLRVYEGELMVFASDRDRLFPLLEFIARGGAEKGLLIFDRVAGNAAALLAIKAGCQEIWSPLGSELAVGTLHQNHVAYHFDMVVPFIQRDDKKGMCPMEELSRGKGPQEFHRILINRFKASVRQNAG